METKLDSLNLYEKGKKGPVLYIRHGQTAYNNICKILPKPEARVKREYLDCPLNDAGKKQAEEIGLSLQDLDISYVFCSPLHRCLETCLLSLKNHSNKEKLRVIIHPYITEIVSGVHDFSKGIKQKKQKFNLDGEVKFDWLIFDKSYPEENLQETYFLDFVDNFEDSEEEAVIRPLIQKIREEYNNADKVDKLLVQMAAYFGFKNKRPESLKHMFNRNLKFKEFIKEKVIQEEIFPNNPDNKKNVFLVYTHSAFTKISTSKIAYNLQTIPDFPEDCFKPDNCEIITMNLI